MYICIVRLIKQNNNKLINKIMKNQVNNSQSTAAVNSANITLSAWSKTDFAWKSMEITDETFNGFKLSSSLFMFLAEAISNSKINTYFILKDSSSQGCGYCFCLSKNDDGYIVVTEDWSGSDHEYYMGNKKRFTDGNIGIFADRLYDIIADFYYGIYEAEAVNNAVEVSEAPSLEQAHSLDETPMLEENDITEDGYSVAGLAYVRESLEDVDVVSMVKDSMGNLFNDPYTMENIMRGGVLDQEKFADALWNIVWEEHLCGLTDEALEAETRYYTDFDALCLQMCSAVAAYDEVLRVVKEKSDSTCGAQGFTWDLFSEETMLTLFDNDSLVEQIRDALFDSVGCSDILLYDDCLYLWYDNDSYKAYIVAA